MTKSKHLPWMGPIHPLDYGRIYSRGYDAAKRKANAKPRQMRDRLGGYERPDYVVMFGWVGAVPTEGKTPIRWADCLVGKVSFEGGV